jgi:8-oxo-dGTP pyrophosphatase MutT (NUDIX family)
MNESLIKKLKKNLKNRGCIIGKDKYFNSAVLIPIIEIENEYHLLFEKRSENIRQGGEVSFPGGEYDSKYDMNIQETAVRETVEELGITMDQMTVIGCMGILVAPMGITVDTFISFLNVNDISELQFDRKEVERVFTIPISYFIKNQPSKYFVHLEVHPNKKNDKGKITESLPVKKLGLPDRYSKPWQGNKHRILVYETYEETIWGITAELVFEFCKLLDNGN